MADPSEIRARRLLLSRECLLAPQFLHARADSLEIVGCTRRPHHLAPDPGAAAAAGERRRAQNNSGGRAGALGGRDPGDHGGGVAVQDLLARRLADIGIGERFAGP